MSIGKNPVRPPSIKDTDDQFQREVRAAIKNLDDPSLRRVTVKQVALSTTTTLVPHRLGKQPVGWQISDQNAQADIWRDATLPVTGDTIPLKASAAVTVDLIFW